MWVFLQNLNDGFCGEWQQINMIGHRWIGHDGCGIGVDEYGLNAVLSQGTKRL
jgi:hypothetical protein